MKIGKICTAVNAIIVHKEPSIISDILFTLPNNSLVIIIEEQEKWAKISYNDIEGYILSSFIYTPTTNIKYSLKNISSHIDTILKEIENINEGKI